MEIENRLSGLEDVGSRKYC